MLTPEPPVLAFRARARKAGAEFVGSGYGQSNVRLDKHPHIAWQFGSHLYPKRSTASDVDAAVGPPRPGVSYAQSLLTHRMSTSDRESLLTALKTHAESAVQGLFAPLGHPDARPHWTLR